MRTMLWHNQWAMRRGPPSPSHTRLASAGLRLVVLDDDARLCRALEREARSVPGVRLVAVTTQAALAAELSDGRVDLVACDFHIGPGVTSAHLVRRLLAEGRPVVVVTSDPEGATAALGDTVVVLGKPVPVRRLVELARRRGQRDEGVA